MLHQAQQHGAGERDRLAVGIAVRGAQRAVEQVGGALLGELELVEQLAVLV